MWDRTDIKLHQSVRRAARRNTYGVWIVENLILVMVVNDLRRGGLEFRGRILHQRFDIRL